jgi:hypothetical protein
MKTLRLTVNEEKTRICHLPSESFDFLGSTFGTQYHPRTGAAYVGPRPSKKKINNHCQVISHMTDPRTCGQDAEAVVGKLNARLRGWSNYFRVGTVVKAYVTVMHHVRRRLRRWLCAKHKVRGSGWNRFSDAYLHGELGLFLFPGCAYYDPCAKTMRKSCPRAGCGKTARPVR